MTSSATEHLAVPGCSIAVSALRSRKPKLRIRFAEIRRLTREDEIATINGSHRRLCPRETWSPSDLLDLRVTSRLDEQTLRPDPLLLDSLCRVELGLENVSYSAETRGRLPTGLDLTGTGDAVTLAVHHAIHLQRLKRDIHQSTDDLSYPESTKLLFSVMLFRVRCVQCT